jgi:hypothetical protein
MVNSGGEDCERAEWGGSCGEGSLNQVWITWDLRAAFMLC